MAKYTADYGKKPITKILPPHWRDLNSRKEWRAALRLNAMLMANPKAAEGYHGLIVTQNRELRSDFCRVIGMPERWAREMTAFEAEAMLGSMPFLTATGKHMQSAVPWLSVLRSWKNGCENTDFHSLAYSDLYHRAMAGRVNKMKAATNWRERWKENRALRKSMRAPLSYVYTFLGWRPKRPLSRKLSRSISGFVLRFTRTNRLFLAQLNYSNMLRWMYAQYQLPTGGDSGGHGWRGQRVALANEKFGKISDVDNAMAHDMLVFVSERHKADLKAPKGRGGRV